MMKYYWILIFLCATFFISEAAPSDSLFKNADSLFKQGEYFRASLAYAEIAYWQDNPAVKAKAILRRAYCYKKTGDYKRAVNVLEQAPFYQISDSLHYLIRYESALNAYLNKNYQEAEAQFQQIYFFINDSILQDNSLYLEILVKNEILKWSDAYKLFIKYVNINQIPENDTFKNRIIELYTYRQPELKNAEKAGLMSTFIPGLGQLYAGYPAEAMLSFGLNAASLTAGVYLIINKYYLTGWLGGLGLLARFYQGGSRRTIELAEKRNSRLVYEFNSQVKKNLLLLEKEKTRQ